MTIARRTGAEEGQLEPQVLAAMVAGAERAAVLHWARQAKPSSALADIVRTAIDIRHEPGSPLERRVPQHTGHCHPWLAPGQSLYGDRH